MVKQGTRVLITGGAGFIGSHLTQALHEAGCKVRVLDDLSTGKRERIAHLERVELLQADVRNPAAVARAMAEMEAVVHLAGVQPGVDATRAQEINLGGALHLLNFARERKEARPRVVLCGSAAVYGRQPSYVLHEELQPRPATPEAVMALTMEHYGRVYRELYGVPVVALRLFRVFGPDEDDARPDAGIVARLLHAALDDAAPVLFGDGQQTRDLIYVDDAVAAIMAALAVRELPAAPLNIASGEAVALNQLWTLVQKACDKQRSSIDPTYVPAPPWEPKHSRPQITRARKELGWSPRVRLREGLERTAAAYLAQRNPNSWFAPKETSHSIPPGRPAATRSASGSHATPLPAPRPSAHTPLPAPRPSAHTPLPAARPSARPARTTSSATASRGSAALQSARPSAKTPLPSRPAADTPSRLAGSARATLRGAARPSIGGVRGAPTAARSKARAAGARPAATPPPPLPLSTNASADEVLEVSDCEMVEDEATELEFEWAPVPAVPGLGS